MVSQDDKLNNERYVKESQCLISSRRSCKSKWDPALVFIAGSGDPSLQDEIKIIEECLKKRHFKPKFAILDQKLGDDAFCDKICSNIKNARFCIVYLTALHKRGELQPSVNVYWEYGLMTGLRKKVIPIIRRDNENIPFNIRHIDLKFYENVQDLEEKVNTILLNLEKMGFSSAPDNFRMYIELINRKNQNYIESEEDFPANQVSYLPIKCKKSQTNYYLENIGNFELYIEFQQRFRRKKFLVFGKYLMRPSEEELKFWIQQIDSYISLEKKRGEKISKAAIGFFIDDVSDLNLSAIDKSTELLIVLIDEKFKKYGNEKAKRFFSHTDED